MFSCFIIYLLPRICHPGVTDWEFVIPFTILQRMVRICNQECSEEFSRYAFFAVHYQRKTKLVQPGVPGHLPKDMKERFGEKFAFWGAIDQQDLLPRGTDDELEKDIIEKISILGKGGGYMIAPAHIIQNDVSPERVLKFIEICKKHGIYK